MTLLNRLTSALRWLVHRKSAEQDLHDELQAFVDMAAADKVREGTPPVEARRLAVLHLGGMEQTKERVRTTRHGAWLDEVARDVRYALRMCARNPGFSTVVIITLALGIGMNTAVFSVVNAVLLRPLAFLHPDRVVWLTTLDPKIKDEFVSSQEVLGWRDAASLERLVAYDEFDGRVMFAGTSTQARIATVTDDFWSLAGAVPVLGHVPVAGESEVLLSHAFFERAFGANDDVVGQPLRVGGREATIAGVLPSAFHVDLAPTPGITTAAPGDIEVYHAIVVRPPQNGRMQLFRVVGQLKPGVSIEKARVEIETIRTRLAKENTGFPFRPGFRVLPLKEKLVGDARTTLIILLSAVTLVLLIGCVNIASLLMARASARQKEIAIRTAVGAGRGRLIRQSLVESLLLALAGGSAGLLVARGCLQVMVRLIPQAVPRLTEATLDGRVLAVALATSVVTALLSGIGPVLALWNTQPYDVLKNGSRRGSSSGGARAHMARRRGPRADTRVAVRSGPAREEPLAAHGASAGICSRTDVDDDRTGYNTGGAQGTETRRREFIDEALRRVRQLPGVQEVGMSTNASGRLRVLIEGATGPMQDRPTALHSSVSAGYAKAIGMRLVAGRWFNDSEPNAFFVVNESLARTAFAGQDPIGRAVQIDGPPGATAASGAKFASIVGVVADLKYAKLDTSPNPEIFADYAHASPFTINIVARTVGDPRAVAPAIRAAVAGVDKAQSVSPVETVEAMLADSIAPRRFTVFLLATFAGSALLLAIIGMYGVIAYSVAQRTGEIGVRMALGAERRTVVRMVVGQGMTMALAGLALGLAAAFATTRVMTSLLYDVTATDPATFAVVVVGLALTAFAACCGPALKAARVDPLVALRYE